MLLIAQGRRVRVLDDFSSGRRENLPASKLLEIVEGDVRDPGVVGRSMRGVTKLLHLAARVSVIQSVEDPVSSAAVNVGGFLVVLDAARRAGVSRVVYASSAAVYGTPAQLPVDEAAPEQPQSPYGLEKSIDDQYATLFGKLYGMQCLGLRYFNVYGPRQDPASPYAGVISRFLGCIRAGRPLDIFGDGEQTRDFVFVEDVARLNLARAGRGGYGSVQHRHRAQRQPPRAGRAAGGADRAASCRFDTRLPGPATSATPRPVRPGCASCSARRACLSCETVCARCSGLRVCSIERGRSEGSTLSSRYK